MSAELKQEIPDEYCFGSTPEANVVAVVGDGTAFDDELELPVAELPPSVILLLEVEGLGIHWMQDGDLDVSSLDQPMLDGTSNARLGTEDAGFFVGFADGQVCFLDRKTPLATLSALCLLETTNEALRASLLAEHAIGAWE